MDVPPGVACMDTRHPRRLLTFGRGSMPFLFMTGPHLNNLSCPLQTLNGESQQKADDLQLETSWRYRVDLPGKQRAQVSENRLDVLASGLAQKLLPCSHRPLGGS